MTVSSTLTRATTVTAMVLAALFWGANSQAAEAVPASATISAVTCVEDDGSVDVTLTAGDSAADFLLSLDDAPYGDGSVIPVAAGQSATVHLTGLSDDAHPILVELAGNPETETEPQTLVEETRTPECDAAPEGAYTNPKGSVSAFCTFDVGVAASNKPIGGNVADLQPATFTLTVEPFADEDGGEEPTDEEPTDERTTEDDLIEPTDPGFELLDPIVLATFTLDADTPTYEKAISYDEIGHVGLITLRVGDTVIASEYFYGGCVVAAAGGAGGAELPNTGA